jgi:hypothetical protein
MAYISLHEQWPARTKAREVFMLTNIPTTLKTSLFAMTIKFDRLQTILFVETLGTDSKSIAALFGILSAKMGSRHQTVRDHDLPEIPENGSWEDLVENIGTLIHSLQRTESKGFDGYGGIDLMQDYIAQASMQAHVTKAFSFMNTSKTLLLVDMPMLDAFKDKADRFTELTGITLEFVA